MKDDSITLQFLSKQLTTTGLHTSKQLRQLKIRLQKSSKPSVLIFNDCFIIGGLERSISMTMNNLASSYNLVFVTRQYTPDRSYTLSKKIAVISLKDYGGEQLIDNIVNLCTFLQITLFIGTQNMMSETLRIYPRLEQCGIKTLSSNHGDIMFTCQQYMFLPVLYYRDQAYICNQASIWHNSRSAQVAQLRYGNALYIPNPLPFQMRKSVKKPGKNILAIGRLDDPFKRFDLTISAFNDIYQNQKDAHLTVVGNIDKETRFKELGDKTIVQYIADQNLCDNITFVGEVKDVLPYYKKADVLLITSESEGFGMTIIEAASQGVPTVAFDVSSLYDLIDHKHTGFLVNFGDTASLAEYVIKIFIDDTLQQQLKKAALNSAKKFEEKKIATQWSDIINQACSNKTISSNTPEMPKSVYRRILQEYDQSLLKLALPAAKNTTNPHLDPNLPWYRKALRYYRMHIKKS